MSCTFSCFTVPFDVRAPSQWLTGSYFEGVGAFLQSANRAFKVFLLKDGDICITAADRSIEGKCLNTTPAHYNKDPIGVNGVYRVTYTTRGELCSSWHSVC